MFVCKYLHFLNSAVGIKRRGKFLSPCLSFSCEAYNQKCQPQFSCVQIRKQEEHTALLDSNVLTERSRHWRRSETRFHGKKCNIQVNIIKSDREGYKRVREREREGRKRKVILFRRVKARRIREASSISPARHSISSQYI